MQSLDTHILFYALNADAPLHIKAVAFLESLALSDDVAICELMLAELYRLLRNPVVLTRPLTAREAVEAIQHFRRHPRWKLIGFPTESNSLHDQLWQLAGKPNFAYRRLYDARLALLLLQHGINEFATANTKDFADLGFSRVWDPLTG